VRTPQHRGRRRRACFRKKIAAIVVNLHRLGLERDRLAREQALQAVLGVYPHLGIAGNQPAQRRRFDPGLEFELIAEFLVLDHPVAQRQGKRRRQRDQQRHPADDGRYLVVA